MAITEIFWDSISYTTANGNLRHEAPPNRATCEPITSVRMGNDVGQSAFDLPDEVCT
jgi:hypothetical protein